MLSKLAPLVVLSLSLHLSAQCAIDEGGVPQPHLSGLGYCTTAWDPDGSGPLPQVLVVGGNNLMGGAQLLGTLPSKQRVMTWDGNTWLPLGGGPGDTNMGVVTKLLSWNGQLIAAGTFTTAGGPNNLARWDGSAWQSIGIGAPANVDAMAIWNGNLVVAGHTGVGTGTTLLLSAWNGTTWSSLPSPPVLDQPTAMVAFEGELIVAGWRHLPTITQGVLERWNGSSWATTITMNGSIAALAVRTTLAVGGSDTLIAGGAFSGIGGASINNVARTNGAPSFTWSAVGGGLPNACHSLLVQNSGLVDYTVVARNASPSTPVMKYATSTGAWTPLGSTVLNALTLWSGSYHGVSSGGANPACHRYDGSQWVPVRGPGLDGFVNAAAPIGNDVVIGGTFASISGVPMNGIARWHGNTFTPLGTGMVGSSIDALVTLDNGDLVAGGNFVAAGGVAVNHVARWNGTTWSAMGNGFDAPVHALCKMPNGDVIAGGAFTMPVGAATTTHRVARWNGTAWLPMDFGMNDDVLALVVGTDGTLFAGGRFTQTMVTMFSIYHVARWTGTQWAGVGTAMNGAVHGLAARPNGDIVATGEFTQVSLLPVDRIARWNGTTWSSMGAASGNAGAVRSVHALANGDIVAGRGFHQPSATADAGISRWNGSSWLPFGSLVGYTTTSPVEVRTIVQRADGDVVVGGNFHVAGFTMAYALATLESTCMPVASTHGTGCSSAAGPLVLTADTLPWVGASFRTTTTGVVSPALCLGVLGFTPIAFPLDQLLAEGQPGCSLLTSLDILMVLTNGPGTAHSTLALANDPALLGAAFFQQTIPLELDGLGVLTAVRGSNALALRIGTL